MWTAATSGLHALMWASHSCLGPGSGVEDLFSSGWNDLNATRVSMWNPQAVVFTDTPVEEVPLERVACIIDSRRDLFPDGVNVEVAHVDNSWTPLFARVFERGCGETEACESGACAIAVAYRFRCHLCCPDRPAQVCMPGGSPLHRMGGVGPFSFHDRSRRAGFFEGDLEIRDILAADLRVV